MRSRILSWKKTDWLHDMGLYQTLYLIDFKNNISYKNI